MANIYRNISGELTQQLLQSGANKLVSKISLTNVHATATVSVDLHIEKKLTGKYYLIKNVSIPAGVTLIYKDGINFSNKKDQFGLFIKLTKSASETPVVDVIIG